MWTAARKYVVARRHADHSPLSLATGTITALYGRDGNYPASQFAFAQRNRVGAGGPIYSAAYLCDYTPVTVFLGAERE